MAQIRRIHITGGPGSGKTTIARRLGLTWGISVHHLDEMALDLEAKMIAGEAFDALAAAIPAIAQSEAWVSEGAYMGWARPLFEQADLVAWIDTPARVALYRILIRHVKAELRRDNRFPGWMRLYHFWRWSARYYAGRNPHRLNTYGVPDTRAFAEEWLRQYAGKLTVCRTKSEVEALLRERFEVPG